MTWIEKTIIAIFWQIVDRCYLTLWMTRSKSDLSVKCTKQYGYCRWYSHTAPAAIKCVSAVRSLQLTDA